MIGNRLVFSVPAGGGLRPPQIVELQLDLISLNAR
jgi:hypothetical protein